MRCEWCLTRVTRLFNGWCTVCFNAIKGDKAQKEQKMVQPKFKNETQKFRHRGFQLQDGTKTPVDGIDIEMVFGNGPAPADPVSSDLEGDHWVTLWDNWIEEKIVVTRYAGQDLPVGDAGTVSDPEVHS